MQILEAAVKAKATINPRRDEGAKLPRPIA